MSFYPQVGAGSVAQFPIQRSRKWRMILNELESGEQIVLPDTAAGQIDWSLSYTDLTDTELLSLNTFFAASQGKFGAFTFIDPLANLFAWSEDFTRPDWQAGLLQSQSNITDPLGTQRASSVSNGASGSQTLAQTLGISGDYVACFSVYVRSATNGTVVLQRDANQIIAPAGPVWQRVFVSGLGIPAATQSTFSITVAPGQTLDLWGLQAEAQPYPSAYRQTVAALGIFEETYFATDQLQISTDSPGLSSCSIRLSSRV
jgi:hypothetical protein